MTDIAITSALADPITLLMADLMPDPGYRSQARSLPSTLTEIQRRTAAHNATHAP